MCLALPTPKKQTKSQKKLLPVPPVRLTMYQQKYTQVCQQASQVKRLPVCPVLQPAVHQVWYIQFCTLLFRAWIHPCLQLLLVAHLSLSRVGMCQPLSKVKCPTLLQAISQVQCQNCNIRNCPRQNPVLVRQIFRVNCPAINQESFNQVCQQAS